MGSLVVSSPFLSASYCPNTALTCCSLVLAFTLPQCFSYKALLCDISCVWYFGTSWIRETSQSRTRCWTNTHLTLFGTYLCEYWLLTRYGMKKRFVPTMAFSDKTKSVGLYYESSFLIESYLCSFITYCFPSIQAVTTAMKTWIQKSSVGFSLIT